MAENIIKDVKLKIGTESQFQSKLKDLPINTLVGTTDPIQEGELDTSIITKLNKAENALPKPTNDTTGSAGQVLKKTANGSEWGDAPSGGGKLYRHYVGLVAKEWNSTSIDQTDYAIGFTVTDTTATAHNRAYWISYFNKLANYGVCTLPEPYIFLNGGDRVYALSSIFGEINYISNEPYIYLPSDGFTTKSDYGKKGYVIDNRIDTEQTYAEYVIEL